MLLHLGQLGFPGEGEDAAGHQYGASATALCEASDYAQHLPAVSA